METQLNCTFRVEQPCLTKCDGRGLLIHVDDLMCVGDFAVWQTEEGWKKFQEQFAISFEELGDTGGAVILLKRKVVKLDPGFALVSGTSAKKAVENVEQ